MKNTLLASFYLACVYVPFWFLVFCLMTNAVSEQVISTLSMFFGIGFITMTPLLIIQVFRDGLKNK